MKKKKAALENDFHKCPMSEGTKKHVGGPIDQGSENVKINSRSAVFIGCSAICIGGSKKDSILEGSGTVFINGKGAARVGDKTEHKGEIKGPGSMNVNIGD